MIRTWIAPPVVNQNPENGVWQAVGTRDDMKAFVRCESTRELALANLDKYLDDSQEWPLEAATMEIC